MATLKELTYMVLDKLKLSSDDSYFNEEHVAFLIGKYRGFLLKQTYKGANAIIPESNYQTISFTLTQVPAIAGVVCECGEFLKTIDKVPFMLMGNPKIYSNGNYTKEISYISRERMRYVGHNKWLKDIIYASLGTDDYIYLTSANPEFLNLKSIEITGIFEHPEQVGTTGDFMDAEYPIEEGLISQVIELVVKDLTGPSYKPEDSINNAEDDLSNLVAFLRRNVKSNLTKAIEGE